MSYEDSVQKAIDYIETHLGEELDLAVIAEESYLSMAQLYRVFYALTGHPVKDYIRKRRLSVAAAHLRNSRRTVEELAWDSGFESYHSFAKVFKKIVGVTPASYRRAEIIYSFEPIRLRERVVYAEDREQAERYPDVKVIRLMPGKAYAYLYLSEREEGMENEAYRLVSEKLKAHGVPTATAAKVRVFGHNVDLPEAGEEGGRLYGYRVLLIGEEPLDRNGDFEEVLFPGGLYAVRKIAAQSPAVIQDGWNRLLAEWLPKSTFEIGDHSCLEEFIAYNGRVTRMNLHLPVQRKLRPEPIEIVHLTAVTASFCRGYGEKAQEAAERGLVDWYEKSPGRNRSLDDARYYMSYAYGEQDSKSYWWENGLLADEFASLPMAGLERKRMDKGLYACSASGTYGLLTGVLERMHRWIAADGSYRLDEERQWFAEYQASRGMDSEREALVKV